MRRRRIRDAIISVVLLGLMWSFYSANSKEQTELNSVDRVILKVSVPLDRALNTFCKKRDAKWFRYVDDVKVFTKSERDAREAVFVINDALRALHLNLQGSKTEILSGESLKYELSNDDFDVVDEAIVKVRKLDPDRPFL